MINFLVTHCLGGQILQLNFLRILNKQLQDFLFFLYIFCYWRLSEISTYIFKFPLVVEGLVKAASLSYVFDSKFMKVSSISPCFTLLVLA